MNKRVIETRNIKSTFAEEGYYPDSIESELCYKTEKSFAYLLNSKILKERYTITLSPEELFILKKYLIITSIRYNLTEAYIQNENPKAMVESYSKDFYNSINKVLECETLNELYTYIDSGDNELMQRILNPQDNFGESKLFSDIKNIVQSYVVFVSTSRCKEDLIIPDVGFSYKATHIAIAPYTDGSFDKCMYTLNAAMQTGNPFLFRVANSLSPYDYIVVPVSKDLAIVSLSVFYKFFNRQADIYGMIPVNGLRVSEMLGFGDNELVEPPRVKNPRGINKCYEYGIKQLSKDDAKFINATFLNNTEQHFGFDDLSKVKDSIEFYNKIESAYKRHDLSFM